MALVQNVLIGKASGSVGNATFASWKGKNILKSKAVNAYSNPSVTQLNNNSKFGVMTLLARVLLNVIQAGFKAGAIGKSEYNVFMQENPYSLRVLGVPGNYYVDTANIVLAKGPEFQEGIANANYDSQDANNIFVAWTSAEFTRDTDLVYVSVFEKATGLFLGSNSATVSENQVTVAAGSLGNFPDQLDVVAFYVNGTTGKACDSKLLPIM